MKTSRFDFELPRKFIAEKPVFPRDSARLLHISDSLDNMRMQDLPSLLRAGDMMVFNNTRVIPACLNGYKNATKISVTLHKRLHNSDGGVWKVFAKPVRKLKVGDKFTVSGNFHAEIIAKGEGGEITLKFNVSGKQFDELLAEHGEPPLPPYITKKREVTDSDKQSYQTIYAKEDGAVAAPTAGLHFTEELFAVLDGRGVKCSFVTLHVGAGTFLPVKVEDTDEHKMHSEFYTISQETADEINDARENGGRIIAVGTTSMRVLESVADENGKLHADSGETDIFITPGYKFRAVDLLLTNFHLPRSTLFMLVCAFAGMEKMQAAYRHAIAEEYRFYSYGDACLISCQ